VTDKRIVDEYKKIKPASELKNRIMCEVLALETAKIQKPFWLRMKPVMSGALACLALVLCLTVIPFNNAVEPSEQLGYGAFTVAYADGTEIMPSGPYAMVKMADDYYEYQQTENGEACAELSFNFEGKTRVNAEYGSLYKKTADGKYEPITSNAILEGDVTLLWELPGGEFDEACVMTLINRSGEWNLGLELFPEGYKANLVKAE